MKANDELSVKFRAKFEKFKFFCKFLNLALDEQICVLA